MNSQLEDNLKFLFRLAAFFGTSPIAWKRRSLRVALTNVLPGVVHITAILSSTIFIFVRGPYLARTTFLMSLYHLRTLLVAIFVPASFSLAFKQLKPLNDVINEILLIDMFVRSAGLDPKVSNSKTKLYLMVIPLSISWYSGLLPWFKGFPWSGPVDWYFNSVSILGTIAISFLISSMIRFLGNYFKVIRRPLLQIRRTEKSKTKIISDMISFIVLSAFFFSLLHLFYMVRFCRSTIPLFVNLLVIGNLGPWALVYFLLAVDIILATTFLAKQAKLFNEVLYQLMLDDKSSELLMNERLNLHIKMKREVVFTAYGCFNLDNSLIHSMVGAATTYLVILIQFGRP